MKREQLGQLILASEDSMYHVAKSLLYNDADCQDAIQETIAKAFDKIGTLKQDTYAKTWLLRILINECYGIMRKEKKIISLKTCEQEEPWMERQDYSDLYEALMGLTEEARLAVTLYCQSEDKAEGRIIQRRLKGRMNDEAGKYESGISEDAGCYAEDDRAGSRTAVTEKDK